MCPSPAVPLPVLAVDDEITLRPRDPEHAEAVFALVDANREYLRRWLPWVDSTRTLEDSRRWAAGENDDDDEIAFVVEYTGEIVGTIGLTGVGSQNRGVRSATGSRSRTRDAAS